MTPAILIDVTKCTGCEKCVDACVLANGVDLKLAERERMASSDGLSANRVSTVHEISSGRFARKSCMHCLDPNCVTACLVGSIKKSTEGPVIYNKEKCIGCRYCMLACPFHIPRYEWGKTAPLMRKCDMCFERQKGGEIPVCVEACKKKALVFGDRKQLLDMARKRISKRPDFYLPRVWGESEYGGTSILYISDIDLETIGWPKHKETAAIRELTDLLIHATPVIGLSVLVGTMGLSAIIRRRNKLMKKNTVDNGETALGNKREGKGD